MSFTGQVLYGLAWLSFGLAHSWLAGARGKAWMESWAGRGARLAYNLIALLHLGLVLAAGQALGPEAIPFDSPPWLGWCQGFALVAGLLLGLFALRGYDLGLFAGTKQLREGSAKAGIEPLVTTGLHRYVRHPLYSAGFLVLFGIARDPLSLATALWAALYLLIGTWFEERKLLRDYGTAYADYRRRVPAFVPWRGRAWRDGVG